MKVRCGLCATNGENIELSELGEILSHFEKVHLENKKNKQEQEKEILRFVSGLQILKD